MFFIFTNDNDKFNIERLYILHRRLMYKIAMKILNDQLLAEDAINETFARVMERASVLRRGDDTMTRNLLVVICKNISIDILRRRQREIVDADLVLSLSEATPSPEPEIIEKELFGEISGAVSRLPVHERDVIVLKIYNRLKYSEIAHILGISPETVKKRLKNAKRKLREGLEGKL